MDILRISNLRIGFTIHGLARDVVKGVSLRVPAGKTVALVGESGSGKSVTLLSLLGLHDAKTTRVDGAVSFKGRPILDLPSGQMRSIRGKEIGLISQDPMTALTPVYTIGWQIAEQIRAHEEVSARMARRRAIELLGEVGLSNPGEAVDRYPHQLSGGMRQRAVIAMALSCNPALLVADEPTTALDVTVQAQVLDLLLRLRKDFGSAIILITHDMGVVAEVAEQVAVMYAGRIVERGSTEQVFSAPLHPYTWGLMASIPPLVGTRLSKLRSIPGMPPTPDQIGEGCGFAPRCDFARPACSSRPPLRRSGDQTALCVLDEAERPALRRATLPVEEIA